MTDSPIQRPREIASELLDASKKSSLFTRADLYALHAEICHDAGELMKRKNHDYADQDDPFGNLNMCEAAGLMSVEQGILVRILDKISRLSRLTRKDHKTAVLDESVMDTGYDIINYTVLLLAKIKSRTLNSTSLDELAHAISGPHPIGPVADGPMYSKNVDDPDALSRSVQMAAESKLMQAEQIAGIKSPPPPDSGKVHL